eukprot:6480264-Amphidinium_carterae.1
MADVDSGCLGKRLLLNHRVVSDYKGVVVALRAVRLRRAKRRHRDLEDRAWVALTPHIQLHWVKAHQTGCC